MTLYNILHQEVEDSLPVLSERKPVFFTVLQSGLVLFLGYLAYHLIFDKRPWIILDGANLLIHEGGHLFFGGFGMFISILGGTLIQIFIPVALILYFIFKQSYFSTFFSLFWLGDNLINISVYAKDAQSISLDLILGGGIHDWNFMLSKLGILKLDYMIGSIFYFFGVTLLLISLFGMIYLIFTSLNSKT